MEFRVLGPLEVREDDRSLPLGGAKQRALLALLLLNANRVLSRERLIDELWGEDPPETAVATVQVYVSRLRKVLGAERLVTRRPGYVLQVAPEELDVDEFERLRTSGRPAEAVALWRGPALAEFKEPFAEVEGGRLEGLRLAALEDRIDADLERGRHAELVGELECLIRRHLGRFLRAQGPSWLRHRRPVDREQLPTTRNTLQRAEAAVFEADPGAGDEILDRARDENFAGLGARGDARAGVDGDACDFAIDYLALAGGGRALARPPASERGRRSRTRSESHAPGRRSSRRSRLPPCPPPFRGGERARDGRVRGAAPGAPSTPDRRAQPPSHSSRRCR
jgi:DNA-binding winged helix-turn-helix (wHTH) protein